ncbi:hypothetical protein VN97_g8281 [Penicillium thymicola]|uniref:Uncharacterized protein n=1 Tax=Penicillium thymicola TaxID=293382 RepID=A0AAI9TDP6_PENTH|nr:hypothetical protein VN97_g8281 [Penicillium thymicola]
MFLENEERVNDRKYMDCSDGERPIGSEIKDVMHAPMLQPAPGLASYPLGQKTIISEDYAQIDQVPIYIVHDMTP